VYKNEMTQLLDPARQAKTKASKDAQDTKLALQQGSRNLKILSDAGVTIALGTDTGANVGQWQGYFEHTELEMMVKAGMTPMQVLVAATGGRGARDEARCQAGYAAKGKGRRPRGAERRSAGDIRNTQKLDAVWIAGRKLAGPR
jgi:hypothetical protein